MKKCSGASILSSVLLAVSLHLQAQSGNDWAVKLNPYKPFIGFVNLGFEQELKKQRSLHIFSEYMVRDQYIIGRDKIEHPLFILQVALRWHLIRRKVYSGPYAGVLTGFSLKRKNTRQDQGLIVGAEFGYKLPVSRSNRFYIDLRTLVHWNSAGNRLLPGFEVLLGYKFSSGLKAFAK